MEILIKVKIVIGVKRGFPRFVALAVFVVTAFVPDWIAAIKVIANVIRHICDD
jgi:hypothetical protein